MIANSDQFSERLSNLRGWINDEQRTTEEMQAVATSVLIGHLSPLDGHEEDRDYFGVLALESALECALDRTNVEAALDEVAENLPEKMQFFMHGYLKGWAHGGK